MHLNFVLAVFGAHLRPEPKISILKRGKRPSICCWLFWGRICDRNARFVVQKGGKPSLILCWPFWELICHRNARFPHIKEGKRPSCFCWTFSGLICDRNARFPFLKGGTRPSVFYFSLVSPPGGGPGEGPDCHFPKGNYDFGPNSARIRRDFN